MESLYCYNNAGLKSDIQKYMFFSHFYVFNIVNNMCENYTFGPQNRKSRRIVTKLNDRGIKMG